MTAISVKQIFRYPVKSMLGESLPSADVGINGILGDRAWAIRDEVRGGIRGAKKLPQLMRFQATSLNGKSAELTAPDGEQCQTSVATVNQWLSAKLAHDVSLWPLMPADNLDHYRRGAPDSDDFEQELRELFGRLPHEPLPDLSAFSEVLEFESPPGTYFDAFPIMVMTQQSLDTLGAGAPNSVFDQRRFRANFLLDAGDADTPFPEQNWIGKTLHMGSMVLNIVETCPRCSMTTNATAELPRDTEVMRHLVKAADGNMGVYAKVVQSGTVSVDDTVQIQ